MISTATTTTIEMEVKEDLTFILNHLDGLWPQMISTYATKGGQRLVNSEQQAMAYFQAANFLDCRISACPKYTNDYINRTTIDCGQEFLSSSEYKRQQRHILRN